VRAVAVRAFRTVPELMELPTPEPKDDEILIRLEAAGVNPFDWKLIDGLFEGRRPHVFPLVVGLDGAGTVAAVGGAVRRFHVGERVAGQVLHDPVGTGTYAEWTAAPERLALARIPDGLSARSAAALPTSGMTALGALDELALGRGATLLVVGASGGVGSIATALAAASGVHVIATARPASRGLLQGLGAAEVLDPAEGDLADRVRRAHGDGLSGLLDAGSDRPTFARLAALVRRGGVAVTTMFVADEAAGRIDGVRRVNLDFQPRAETLERLFSAVVAGSLTVPVTRVLPLADGPRAIAESRARTAVGKTVLAVR